MPGEPRDGGPLGEHRQAVELDTACPGDRIADRADTGDQACRRPERRAVLPTGQRHAAARRPRGHLTLGPAHAYSDAIPIERLPGPRFVELLRSPFAHEELADRGPLVLVDTDDIVADARDIGTLASIPVVVAGDHRSQLVDIVVDDGSLEDIARTVERWPIASVALAVLLRSAERRSVADGLVAESAVYSLLQAGPEFARWRAERPSGSHPQEGPAVRCEREGDRLLVTLSRPGVHNAFSAAMRDELVEALAVARADLSIKTVVLSGEGKSFCSGGDLDEFGSRPDPATAHVLRLQRSAPLAVASVAERLEARLHGACLGAGIELAAFARHVVATEDAAIGLPEVTLGLIPGAGGTVSVTARAGRHNTAWLALSGSTIDADTARAWGLVDEIVDST
ncbi:MAG: enoyl-CoA hydratase/isomerase family protein [Acidimicrobiia bacterium]|nr:enoyl-CoA hydratase/isomerase family protein [Acidimicrobiia bacterium]